MPGSDRTRLRLSRRALLATAAAGAAGSRPALGADRSGDGSTPAASQTGYGAGGYGEGGYGGVAAAGPGDVTGNGAPATDPDDDDLYENVDGEGRFDVFDVGAFLEVYGDRAVQDNPDAFNFDGRKGVDIFDVAELLEELS